MANVRGRREAQQEQDRRAPWPARGIGSAVAALALLVAAVAAAPPAGATVTSLSPASATVAPGGGARTTARVSGEGVNCVSATPSSPAISVDVSPVCSDAGTWSATVTVSASGDATPGTYTVRVDDDKGAAGDAKTFTLRVAEPPPPPTTTTTATPPPPTSTTTTAAPVTTTTASTTTTIPPTTTTTGKPSTTTTLAPPPPGGGFEPVADLVAAGVPDEGVLLPLESPGFRDCLPLSEPCVDPASALVLVPARTTEVTWHTLGADERTSPGVDLRGLEPLGPVGTGPTDPGAQDYSLPILDLEASGGQVRSLVRGLDAQGRFLTPRGLGAVAAPKAEGPMATPESKTFLASAPFGRPRLATKADLSEAAPAIALFSSTQLQVVYAIRPDPTWGVNATLLPLLGTGAVPYLVRGVDGPPALYVARPAGLRIATAGSLDTTTAADAKGKGGDGGSGRSPLLLLLGAVVVGGVPAAVLSTRRRRRRQAADVAAARRATEEARSRLNRPRGTSR